MEQPLSKALQNLGIEALKPMQEAAHKAILKDKAVVLVAPTGSGKTVGFLYPLLQLLNPDNKQVQCLVLVPSRELALQIEQVWKKMSTGFKVNVCYGGHSSQTETKNLSNPPALLIGTPGRIADHINRGSFSLDAIHTLILDEFDKSLEMGFQDDMEFILGGLKNLNKKILVSATPLLQIPSFAKVVSPTEITFTAQASADMDALSIKRVVSDDKDKLETLVQLVCSLNSEPAILFCNHRETCERVADYFNSKGIVTGFYHGGMEQEDRERALIKFRNGTVNYLVTTDLAARGLDIPEMNHVIHIQLPKHEHEFVHRNGRTARMHATGTAYLVLNREETLPEYVDDSIETLHLKGKGKLPTAPLFQTLYIGGGKKNKLNKFDIVGSLMQKGQLQKDDLGLITVKDFSAFVAVKSTKVKELLVAMKEEKIKGKKYKIEVAH